MDKTVWMPFVIVWRFVFDSDINTFSFVPENMQILSLTHNLYAAGTVHNVISTYLM